MKFHDVDKLVSMKFLMARFGEYDSIVLCVTQVRNRMTLEQMLNVIKDILGSPKHQKIMSVSIVLDQMPRSGKVGQQEFRPIFVFTVQYCCQHWCKIFFKRRKSHCVIFKWIVNMQIWEGNWYKFIFNTRMWLQDKVMSENKTFK